jgi:hypothetical protein
MSTDVNAGLKRDALIPCLDLRKLERPGSPHRRAGRGLGESESYMIRALREVIDRPEPDRFQDAYAASHRSAFRDGVGRRRGPRFTLNVINYSTRKET